MYQFIKENSSCIKRFYAPVRKVSYDSRDGVVWGHRVMFHSSD